MGSTVAPHTLGHTQRELNSLMDSFPPQFRLTYRNTELWSKTNSLCNSAAPSHTSHKQINSQLCFVTPRFILKVTCTHANTHTHEHHNRATRVQDSFKYTISISLFEQIITRHVQVIACANFFLIFLFL